MNRAAQSLFAFGCYVLAVGVSFLVAPAAMVSLLKLPDAPVGWLRVVGLLALVIGAYDITAAKAGITSYFRVSVYVRFGFAFGVALLVMTRQMPPAALPLGVVDAAGAAWTWFALRPVAAAA